jgi:hypothetical protein
MCVINSSGVYRWYILETSAGVWCINESKYDMDEKVEERRRKKKTTLEGFRGIYCFVLL